MHDDLRRPLKRSYAEDATDKQKTFLRLSRYPLPCKEPTGAWGGIGFLLTEFVRSALNAQGRYIMASERRRKKKKKMEDEGWWVKWREQPSKQWCLSEILRRFKAPGGSALRYSLGQPRLGTVSRPGYSPSTHTHAHTHTHTHTRIHTHSWTLWGSYCHGNQPLYDYSLLRRIIGTNLSQPLSLSLSVSFFSFFLAAISSRPSSLPGPAPFFPLLHVQEQTLHVLLFPPSSPLSSLLSACLWPSWVWFAVHNLSTLGFVQFSQVEKQPRPTQTVRRLFSSCSQRNVVKRGIVCHLKESRRAKYLVKNRKIKSLVASFAIFL